MAEAYMCDRCGVFQKDECKNTIKLQNIHYDLCDTCVYALKVFLQGAEVDFKSLRMKPVVGYNLMTDISGPLVFVCPICTGVIDETDADVCRHCGQKLQWSDTE